MPEAKNSVVKKEESKKDKFDWADEGLSALVRVVILSWSAAILTLNYVTIPGVPQKNIDPTFMASVFTGTPATFGVTPAKKKDDSDSAKKEDDKKSLSLTMSSRLSSTKRRRQPFKKSKGLKNKNHLLMLFLCIFSHTLKFGIGKVKFCKPCPMWIVR